MDGKGSNRDAGKERPKASGKQSAPSVKQKGKAPASDHYQQKSATAYQDEEDEIVDNKIGADEDAAFDGQIPYHSYGGTQHAYSSSSSYITPPNESFFSGTGGQFNSSSINGTAKDLSAYGGNNEENTMEHDQEISSDESEAAYDRACANEDFRSYRVEKSKEFEPGRVIKCFLLKPKPGIEKGDSYSRSPFSTPRVPEFLTSDMLKGARQGNIGRRGKARLFVIIQTFQSHSIAVPIRTYNGRGTTKPGCHPEVHAMAYSGCQRPEYLPSESPLPNPAIRMDCVQRQELDNASRICYARRYAIEHNTPIVFVGRIAKESSDPFWHSVNYINQTIQTRSSHLPEPVAQINGQLSSKNGDTRTDWTPYAYGAGVLTGVAGAYAFGSGGSRGAGGSAPPTRSSSFPNRAVSSSQEDEEDRSYTGPRSSSNIYHGSNVSGGRNGQYPRTMTAPPQSFGSGRTYQLDVNDTFSYGTAPSSSSDALQRYDARDYTQRGYETSLAIRQNSSASQRYIPSYATAAPQSQSSRPVEKINLLSLDGGGVRGLSSLLILRDIMTRVNHEREDMSLPTVKPCDIFDLIGGTSTGGIIAIMLGRLEMDVDECIDVYTNLFSVIFEKAKSRFKLSWNLEVKNLFDASILETETKSILKGLEGFDDNTTLRDPDVNHPQCRVAVCAVLASTGSPVLMRSYRAKKSPSSDFKKIKIWQAVRATSAATGFFDPITLEKMTFIDGGFGMNNPVSMLYNEAVKVWGKLDGKINCYISIGTGDPGITTINNKAGTLLSAMKSIVTETSTTANQFKDSGVVDRQSYFRFNVDQGLQDVGLAEYDKEDVIRSATLDYMENKVGDRAEECAEKLTSYLNERM